LKARTALVSLILLGAAVPGPAQEASSLKWETNWPAAFERARAEHRLVFADYWATWCNACMEMERRTFPDPRVSELLQNFVLLKLNADNLGQIVRRPGVSSSGMSLPTYKFFDPGETERLKLLGFRPPEDFADKLALIAASAPAMVQAAESLKQKDSARGHLLLGRAYLRARAPTYARDELESAAKLAKRESDAALAQTAETLAALTLALEDKAPKALKLLEKIAADPASPDCAAGAWVAIGQVRSIQRDSQGAADAYRRALSLCPDQSPVRRDAETALAQLEKP
jgi:thiol-disulfide isomerase/thioredoxin